MCCYCGVNAKPWNVKTGENFSCHCPVNPNVLSPLFAHQSTAHVGNISICPDGATKNWLHLGSLAGKLFNIYLVKQFSRVSWPILYYSTTQKQITRLHTRHIMPRHPLNPRAGTGISTCPTLKMRPLRHLKMAGNNHPVTHHIPEEWKHGHTLVQNFCYRKLFL
jgi:hypothetical protein